MRNPFFSVSVCVLLTFLKIPAVHGEFSRGADSQPASPSRFELRKQYQHAIYLITSRQRSGYLKIRDDLRQYPLFPYLEYTDKIYRISRQTPEDIRQFADQYHDTPLMNLLLQQYLNNLGKRGHWDTFLEFYLEFRKENAINHSRENNCYYPYALARTGDTRQAMMEARKLWLVDYSQPGECDPVFKLWRHAGNPDARTAWQRYAISLKSNEITLANYLVRFLANEDRTFASNLKRVHTRPDNIKRTERFRQQHPYNRELIIHGIRRLARSQPGAAFDLLRQYKTQHTFKAIVLTDTYSYVGRHWASTNDADTVPENLAELLPVDLNSHPELISALIRLALRHANWDQVLLLIHRLPKELQLEPRWQYWKARVLADSADTTDQKIAEEIYRKLTELRNIYGFLAADLMQLPYNFVDKPTPVTNEEILAMELTPGIQRALELFTLGELALARREWYFTTRNFSNKERAIAANVASRWGWYKSAIQSLIDAELWNDLALRFPIGWQEIFVRNARREDIPVDWSLAIARQESAFVSDARSPAGALGVMQLMPATAKIVARKAGIRYRSPDELTDPQFNIQLGSQYLGQMLRQFNNNRIFASAAYNAGPTRVEQWAKRQLPLDVWIETIPFSETRNYVQNVLMFAAIYRRQLNLQQPLIQPHEYEDFSDPQAGAEDPQAGAKE